MSTDRTRGVTERDLQQTRSAEAVATTCSEGIAEKSMTDEASQIGYEI
jgi:hypothetical protein